MADAEKTIRIEVLRYRPEQDRQPVPQTYTVPFTHDTSVLEGLQYIKDYLDGTLSFRWSCRMAICGSRGMMIDGTPKLACKTFLRDYRAGNLHIEALAHLPIERDLIVTVEDYVKRLEGIKPYLIPREARTLEEGEYLQTPQQQDRCLSSSGTGVPTARDKTPLNILRERYARGEIDKAVFAEKELSGRSISADRP